MLLRNTDGLVMSARNQIAPADVLIFAEDPGAANFVVPLPQALAAHGHSSVFVAIAHAATRARALGTPHVELSDDPDIDSLMTVIRPSLVITGTSDRIDAPGMALIAASRALGIPSLGIVDGQAAYGHRFRSTGDHATSFAPDWLAVPDEITAENYAGVGFPRRRIRVIGNPHFDTVRQATAELLGEQRDSIRRRLGLPPINARQVVVFATEISRSRGHADHSWRPDDTLHGFSGTKLRTHIVLEEVIEALSGLPQRPYLVLRLHPKTPREEFQPYLSHFDGVSEGEDVHPTTYAADLVIGLSTILLEEAPLFGTPSLAVIRRSEERTWLTGVRDGWIPHVMHRTDISRAIAAGLARDRDDARTVAEQMLPSGGIHRLAAWTSEIMRERAL